MVWMQSLVRSSLLLGLLLVSLPVSAAWTGIGAFVIQGKSDWAFNGDELRANFTRYGLRIEEKTDTELRVGASGGQVDIKFIDRIGAQPTEKYSGEFLSFYLRWPYRINNVLSLHGLFDYQYVLGDQLELAENEITWSEISLNLGISARLGRLSIRPFVEYRDIDGDITASGSTRLFQLDEERSEGVVLDYFVEKTAFLRLRISQGGYRSFMLSMAREF
jgi:hypothetical protein